MTSLIEQQRSSHSQQATTSSHLVDYLVNTPQTAVSTHRERLHHAHRSSFLVDQIVDLATSLSDTYQDPRNERLDEIAILAGGPSPAPGQASALAEFYDRLVKVKEWHRKNPVETSLGITESGVQDIDWSQLEGMEGTGEWLDRMFSGEEGLGRYLDLIEAHNQYMNLPGTSRITYLGFLDEFDQFDKIEKSRKLHGEKYRIYLESLERYLTDFLKRAVPLFDVMEMQQHAALVFEKKWQNSQVKDWQSNNTTSNEGIWCPACQKMYSKETVYQAHLTSKKHLKAVENSKKAGNVNTNGSNKVNGTHSQSQDSSSNSTASKEKQLAFLEDQISNLLSNIDSPLIQIRQETKSNTERKAALTDRERQLEIEEMEKREAAEAAKNAKDALNAGKRDPALLRGEDEEESERLYNPLKLPLGWDGKPIPYWLYKLHGLGVEYPCEICSGATYAGRKNFERHFSEARHTFGMKALGLPNTKHFHEITKIEDAVALAEKLKAEGKAEIFRAEETEELEDAEGNVYNKKLYNDLKNQGLI